MRGASLPGRIRTDGVRVSVALRRLLGAKAAPQAPVVLSAAAAPSRLRKARVKQATPAWGNRQMIAALYRNARALTLKTGIPYQVDHVLPIAGRNVSGLHVEHNLQVITARENRRRPRVYKIQ